MKSLQLTLIVSAWVSITSAQGAGLQFTDEVTHKSAKPTEIPTGDGSGTPGKSLGLGLSTLSAVTGTTGALIGQIELSSQNALQILFGLDSTSPIDFGMGVLYRHDLNDNPVGLHVGGGVGFGAVAAGFATNTVFVNVVGLAGMHFRVPGATQVEILADAGAVFSAGSAGANFQLGALSSLLGVSVVYHLGY